MKPGEICQHALATESNSLQISLCRREPMISKVQLHTPKHQQTPLQRWCPRHPHYNDNASCHFGESTFADFVAPLRQQKEYRLPAWKTIRSQYDTISSMQVHRLLDN